MKQPRLILALSLVPAVLLLSCGCSKAQKDSTAEVVQDIKASAVETWDSVKSFTYEQRVDFSASINRMTKAMDTEIATAKTKLNEAPDAAAKDREASIKDYDDAKADLKKSLDDLNKSTAANWADAKEKVAEAWHRMRSAYDNATKDRP